MKANSENVFMGATVEKDKQKFLVVKVNAKSMYVANGWTLEEYNKAYSLKSKSETFKQFCERNKIEMVKFDGYEISEAESAKREIVKETQKSSSLGKAEKLVISRLLEKNKLRKLMNIQVGDKIMRILENQENKKFLINIDNDYVLYNRELDASVKISTVYDYKEKYDKVPWEKITPKEKTA